MYGTVKQHEGYISVESTPGTGATFRIYLPRAYEDAVAPPEAPRDGSGPPRGSGVVLLVEDEAEVRVLADDILRMSGYTVLAAAGARDALVLAERHAGRIHLLVTDVIMPHMSGSELADRLTQLRPGLKVNSAAESSAQQLEQQHFPVRKRSDHPTASALQLHVGLC